MEVFCSCQEAKSRHVARKLNAFEEHLLGSLLVNFNGFFQNFYCRIHFFFEYMRTSGIRTTHNFARKQMRKISLKFHKFSCRTHLYLLNRLKFVNYMKSCSCRTPPKLPGAKHRENTCLVCATRWLLSYVYHYKNCFHKELV